MEPFIHLHVHTQYSLLDGQASIDALIDKAQKDGMPAIAVTDHGVMFGYLQRSKKRRKKYSNRSSVASAIVPVTDGIASLLHRTTEADGT